jgi:hypothetical protein
VGEVYGLLAQLMGTATPDVADEADASTGDLGPVATDDQLIRRIYEESHEAHRRLFKRLAESPDQWVYASDLAADLELPQGNKSRASVVSAGAWRSLPQTMPHA